MKPVQIGVLTLKHTNGSAWEVRSKGGVLLSSWPTDLQARAFALTLLQRKGLKALLAALKAGADARYTRDCQNFKVRCRCPDGTCEMTAFVGKRSDIALKAE